MAPNSSSLFNEAPAEAKPSSVPAPPPASPTSGAAVPSPSPSPAVSIATSAVSASTSSSSSTTSSSSSNVSAATEYMDKKTADAYSACCMKTPKEHTTRSESSADHVSSKPRFARVVFENYKGSPSLSSELETMKTTLAFRKSCLKRSKSTLPRESPCLMEPEPEIVRVVEGHAQQIALPTSDTPAAPVQKNRRRCWECKVKVGLTAVTCRCDFTFCNKHRYAEEHNCAFNFKGAGKRKLQDENPRVVPMKVARIN